MKKFIVFFVVACLIFTITGCSSGTNSQNVPQTNTAQEGNNNASKELVVYCPHPLELINPIVSRFESETGINVNVVAAGTGELLKRVESEASNPLGDVLWGGSILTVQPYQKYFEKYLSANEPNMQDQFKNVEGTMTRFSNIPSVIMVNTNLIGDIPMKGFEDLLNPALKGKIAFADPSASSSSFEMLVNMLYAMGNGDPEKGWDYVGKLIKNLDGKLLSGSSAVYKGVADGEYTVGLTFEEAAANYKRNGAPIDIVYMKEGVMFNPDCVMIIKGAKNLENAKKFVDFVTGSEAQKMLAKDLNRRPVIKDIPLENGLIETSQIEKTVRADRNWVLENKQAILTQFKDMFTSN
ncbi:MAG TPA: extracellular solute-binding protein [Thermoanaerobacterales bacterium]|nr:extracellular solute-binding protein [Thermoanaerobacterales bacterium]